MKNQSKAIKLESQRNILLHTLDFLITHYTGYFVTDDFDTVREYYIQKKAEVEKYFAEESLARLNTMLKKFRKQLYLERDEHYPGYIATSTGFSLKLYDELSNNIHRIRDTKKVENYEDALEVEFLIAIYKNTPNHGYDTTELYEYLEDYRNNYVERVGSGNTLQGGVKSMLVDTPHLIVNNSMFFSPNGKNWIKLENSGEEEFLRTYVVAGVDRSNGPIYSVKGKGLGIRIEWADDNTILIHCSREHEVVMSYTKLKTKHSTISIQHLFDSKVID